MEQFCDPSSGQVLGLTPEDYTFQISDKNAAEELRSIRASRLQKILDDKGLAAHREAVSSLPIFKSKHLDFSKPQVTIGSPDEVSTEDLDLINKSLKTFVPWKKGPYNLFGTEIDTEWRSDIKWDRIRPFFNLKDKKVADIGCHNGYFMFRMAEDNPKLVVGIEPMPLHYLNFQLMQRFAQVPSFHFELLGVEHMHLWPKFFDTIFCMGILYHHTDPIGLLRKIHSAMKPGAELIVDCQGIPGEDPVALMPKGRYAQARGIWWLPTQAALNHWLHRTMFSKIEYMYAGPLEGEEQRQSDWAQVRSLADFLDPNDPTKTIEGYPAPHRFYVKCRK
jgi:tRNA (mo5U34)-methyltransferase